MIPSPKVPTYDQQPEMSVQSVADKVAELVKESKYEFVMCNFAPPDMVRLFLVVSLPTVEIPPDLTNSCLKLPYRSVIRASTTLR